MSTPHLPQEKTPPGSRERGMSPWLGRGVPPSPDLIERQRIERELTAFWAPWSPPVAPATALSALFDWSMHLMMSPAKQWELMDFAAQQWHRAWMLLADIECGHPWCVDPLPQDKRFADERWHQPPFAPLAQNFLLWQQWWERATSAVPGLQSHHEQMVEFAARQWLDLVSPSNFVATNPVVLEQTAREHGMNLLRGAAHAIDDLEREWLDQPPAGAEMYEVGVGTACTPGKVVLRNALMELLQYTPTTDTVHAEPVLLVPAWIMKYYVLDLTPQESLVKYLVDHGFTVFAISWKNPLPEDRDLGLDDYRRLGVLAALDALEHIVPGRAVHAVGYCLGGTLLALTAAALGRAGNHRLKTMTLLAAQTDFSEPGELSLFIDESQAEHLETLMSRRGLLEKEQMKISFQLLRSRDLIWSYRLMNYLLGERQALRALMAWNADGTRLPYRMHSEYLRAFYLHNLLARGEYVVDGESVDLTDIHVPIFSVGTVQDHVAPWRSVYRLHRLTDTDQTFVLA
ncbi:MAG TPA: alpha/beta fold hydrolase, partial [Burkholderiaceae bacterium]|nr:alpha/beta fold hydrolase [Burkholderiaceae bacterium]